MFSVLGVFSVLGFAVVACVGLDCELSVFPCFGGFGVFFFAVWTLSHNDHRCVFVRLDLKRFIACWGGCFHSLQKTPANPLFFLPAALSWQLAHRAVKVFNLSEIE